MPISTNMSMTRNQNVLVFSRKPDVVTVSAKDGINLAEPILIHLSKFVILELTSFS